MMAERALSRWCVFDPTELADTEVAPCVYGNDAKANQFCMLYTTKTFELIQMSQPSHRIMGIGVIVADRSHDAIGMFHVSDRTTKHAGIRVSIARLTHYCYAVEGDEYHIWKVRGTNPINGILIGRCIFVEADVDRTSFIPSTYNTATGKYRDASNNAGPSEHTCRVAALLLKERTRKQVLKAPRTFDSTTRPFYSKHTLNLLNTAQFCFHVHNNCVTSYYAVLGPEVTSTFMAPRLLECMRVVRTETTTTTPPSALRDAARAVSQNLSRELKLLAAAHIEAEARKTIQESLLTALSARWDSMFNPDIRRSDYSGSPYTLLSRIPAAAKADESNPALFIQEMVTPSAGRDHVDAAEACKYVAGSVRVASTEGGYTNAAAPVIKMIPSNKTTSGLLFETPRDVEYKYVLEHGHFTVPSKFTAQFRAAARPTFHDLFSTAIRDSEEDDDTDEVAIPPSAAILAAQNWETSARFRAFVKVSSHALKRKLQGWDEDGDGTYETSTKDPICPTVAYNMTSFIAEVGRLVNLTAFLLLCREAITNIYRISFVPMKLAHQTYPKTTFEDLCKRNVVGDRVRQHNLPWADPDGPTEAVIKTVCGTPPAGVILATPVDASLFGITFGCAAPNDIGQMRMATPCPYNEDNPYKTTEGPFPQHIIVPDEPAFAYYPVQKVAARRRPVTAPSRRSKKLLALGGRRFALPPRAEVQIAAMPPPPTILNAPPNGTALYTNPEQKTTWGLCFDTLDCVHQHVPVAETSFRDFIPHQASNIVTLEAAGYWNTDAEQTQVNILAHLRIGSIGVVYIESASGTHQSRATVMSVTPSLNGTWNVQLVLDTSLDYIELSGPIVFCVNVWCQMYKDAVEDGRYTMMEEPMHCLPPTFTQHRDQGALRPFVTNSGLLAATRVSEIIETPERFEIEALRIRDNITKNKFDRWALLPLIGMQAFLATHTLRADLNEFLHTFGSQLSTKALEQYHPDNQVHPLLKVGNLSFAFTDMFETTSYFSNGQRKTAIHAKYPNPNSPAGGGAGAAQKCVPLVRGIHYMHVANNRAMYNIKVQQPCGRPDSAYAEFVNPGLEPHRKNMLVDDVGDHARVVVASSVGIFGTYKVILMGCGGITNEVLRRTTRWYPHPSGNSTRRVSRTPFSAKEEDPEATDQYATRSYFDDDDEEGIECIDMKQALEDMYKMALRTANSTIAILTDAITHCEMLYSTAESAIAQFRALMEDVQQIKTVLTKCEGLWANAGYHRLVAGNAVQAWTAQSDRAPFQTHPPEDTELKDVQVHYMVANSIGDTQGKGHQTTNTFYEVLSFAFRLSFLQIEAITATLEPAGLPAFDTSSFTQTHNARYCPLGQVETTMAYVVKQTASSSSILYNSLLDPTPRMCILKQQDPESVFAGTRKEWLTWTELAKLYITSLKQFSSMSATWLQHCDTVYENTNPQYTTYNDQGSLISGDPVPGGVFVNEAGVVKARDTKLGAVTTVVKETTNGTEAQLSLRLIAAVAAAPQPWTMRDVKSQIPRTMKTFGKGDTKTNISLISTFGSLAEIYFGELLTMNFGAEPDHQAHELVPHYHLKADRFVFKLADERGEYCKLPGTVTFDDNPDFWHVGSCPVPFLEASFLTVKLLHILSQL